MTDIQHDLPTEPMLTLGLDGYTYADLYDPAALAKLYGDFCAQLADSDANVSARYLD